MKSVQSWLTAISVALAPIAAAGDIPTQSGLSMYIARMAATALPYTEDIRWESYLTISRLAEVLNHEDRYGTEIATLMTETFPGFPFLVLTDQDGDHRADFFAYHETDEREFTREFGAFFTVGDNPKPAWIVFNSGLMFEDFATNEPVPFWATYQFVDRNDDGRFDLCVFNGADADGDGNFLERDTGWLFDDDGDGLVDRAESNLHGKVQTLEPADGVFHFGGLLMNEFEISSHLFEFPNAIAADILNALRGAEQ